MHRSYPCVKITSIILTFALGYLSITLHKLQFECGQFSLFSGRRVCAGTSFFLSAICSPKHPWTNTQQHQVCRVASPHVCMPIYVYKAVKIRWHGTLNQFYWHLFKLERRNDRNKQCPSS